MRYRSEIVIFCFKIGIMFVLTSCNIQPSYDKIYRQDIIGIYKANFIAGIEEFLELKEDGDYIHHYLSFDSVKYEDSGTWRLIYESEDSTYARIRFSQFINRYPIWNGGYSKADYAECDTTPQIWRPFVYVNGDFVWIEKTHRIRQFYEKSKRRAEVEDIFQKK